MSDTHLGFVFPGQGSQSTGMLAELYGAHGEVRRTFEEASAGLGFDLWQTVQNNPGGELDRTQNTQPALLTASIAIWRLWRSQGGALPSRVAGHSLGEYSALVCAGVLEFSDAVTLVADRGRLMQEAVPEGTGAMAAILGLDDGTVMEVCHRASRTEQVSAANFNADGQVVVAGHHGAVETVITLAREAGAKRAMLLAVSVPSHCELMRGAADRFAERLAEVGFAKARIPVVQNVDARQRQEAGDIRDALVRQLHQPVHWWKSIREMKNAGVQRIIECGPGRVLSGLIRRIDRSLEVMPIHDSASLAAALEKEGGGQ